MSSASGRPTLTHDFMLRLSRFPGQELESMSVGRLKIPLNDAVFPVIVVPDGISNCA